VEHLVGKYYIRWETLSLGQFEPEPSQFLEERSILARSGVDRNLQVELPLKFQLLFALPASPARHLFLPTDNHQGGASVPEEHLVA